MSNYMIYIVILIPVIIFIALGIIIYLVYHEDEIIEFRPIGIGLNNIKYAEITLRSWNKKKYKEIIFDLNNPYSSWAFLNKDEHLNSWHVSKLEIAYYARENFNIFHEGK